MSMDGHFCRRCGKFFDSCECANPVHSDADVHRGGISRMESDHKDPREELRARLARHGRAIRRIEVIWNAADDSPRMTVTLKDCTGQQIDQWEDWMILWRGSRSDVVAIDQIIEAAFGQGAIEDFEAGFCHRYYTIG